MTWTVGEDYEWDDTLPGVSACPWVFYHCDFVYPDGTVAATPTSELPRILGVETQKHMRPVPKKWEEGHQYRRIQPMGTGHPRLYHVEKVFPTGNALTWWALPTGEIICAVRDSLYRSNYTDVTDDDESI